jgi:diguanylate cyclase (GGDEF)-like protein
MKSRSFHLMRSGIFAVSALVLAICGCAIYFAHGFLDASAWVAHTTEVIGEIRNTRLQLGVHGTSLNHGSTVSIRIPVLLEQAQRVADLTQDNPQQQKNIAEFRALFEHNVRQDEVDVATIGIAHDTLDRIQGEEYRLLAIRSQRLADATHRAVLGAALLCASMLLLVTVTSLAARREFHRRERAEDTLLREKLELTRHSRELALVAAGSELIQAAADESQVEQAVAQIMCDLLPGSDGYFGLISPSRDIVEVCASWGDSPAPGSFAPGACLALQLGRQIHWAESLVLITCAHCPDLSRDHLCIPIRSGEGHLGVLHVSSTEPLSAKSVESVSLFAGKVALGLTNLRMREALRSQTVRDGLTGLFNRRYFDETLQRELAAARRVHAPVSVLMIDLDHFKRTNDTFGHAAGDEALRTVGRLLRSAFRESDVVCRYGGEEFAVILPNADVHDAYARAESFRKQIELTELGGASRTLGPVSTSIGLASSAEFESPQQLLHAADCALYQAKEIGRNTTCVSTAHPLGIPPASICRRALRLNGDTPLLSPPQPQA